MRVFLFSLALLLPLCLLVGSPRAVEAQTVDWQRYYPLEVGNVWEYQTAHRPRFFFMSLTGFQRRTVVGDTTIGSEAYGIVAVERFAPDYVATDTSRCAVRVVEETGRVEWEPLAGDGCDALEDNGALDLRGGVPASSSILFVSLTAYDFEAVRAWSFDNDLGDYTLAADLGLVAWQRNEGPYGEEDLFRLVYAEVGGTTYGSPFDSKAWKALYPLHQGDVREYTDRYDYGNGPTTTQYFHTEIVGEATVGGEVYNRVVNRRFSEDLVFQEESVCGVRLNEATGKAERVLISGTFCPDYGDGWDLRLMHRVEESVVFNAPVVIARHGYLVPQASANYARYALGIGFFGGSWSSSGSGGGSWGDTDLLYAVVNGVSYGAPVVSTEAPPPDVAERALALTTSPNPFRSSIVATLTLRRPDAVHLALFDARGRRVLTRDLGTLPAGRHAVPLAGADLAPGVYVVRAETTSGQQAARRVVRVE